MGAVGSHQAPAPQLAVGAASLTTEHVQLPILPQEALLFIFLLVPKYRYSKHCALGTQIRAPLKPQLRQPILLSSSQPYFELELSGKIRIHCPYQAVPTHRQAWVLWVQQLESTLSNGSWNNSLR